MCISPSNVWVQRGPKWEQVPVPCKRCWRCKQNRVNDYVARALCEAATSQVSCTVSMTYADRSDLAERLLTPKHFQLFIKLLRNAGHKVRYLVAGEYGEEKGRAHFHAILFFQHLVPLDGRGIIPRYKDDYPEGYTQDDAPFCREIPHQRMVHIREWPHGHIKVDWSASEKSARYVCKYLLADDKNNAWLSMSKKPALGAAWFAQKAARSKDFGLLPSSFEYLPPGGDAKRPYLMTGATRRDYLNAITIDPARRGNMSEWVKKTFDKHDKERIKKVCETWRAENPHEFNALAAASELEDANWPETSYDDDWIVWWWLNMPQGFGSFDFRRAYSNLPPDHPVFAKRIPDYGQRKERRSDLWRIGGQKPCDGVSFIGRDA